MTARPYVLAEANWRAVRSTSWQVAVLPWGATEAHNYHLPYATDTIQCDHIAAEACRIAWEADARCVALPTIPFGVNTGQINLPLHINMNPSTQLLVLGDIVDALSRQGIPKLVILNGHGGNDFKQMIRELTPRYPNVFLCTLNWYQMLDAAKYFDDLGDHAGEMETSLIMHLEPELALPLDQAGSGAEAKPRIKALRERKAWTPRDWPRVTADTGIGNPAASSAEKGERYFHDVTKEIAQFLIDLAETDINQLYAD
jgi:creatinine amidohydrolase